MSVLQWIISIAAVCIAFGFIITIHELGHFLIARKVGIRCPRFSLGFGPRLFSFNYKGTEFSISLLPLGGYVMMLGEDPENDETQDEFKKVSAYLPESALPGKPEELVKALEKVGEDPEKVPEADKQAFASVVDHVRYLPERVYNTVREVEGNFNDKNAWARMAVILGGVTMNFISALIMFWIIGACYGLVDLAPRSMPIVMKVFDNSPAAVAGLAYGDKIESVDGSPVVSGSDMIRLIAKYPAQKIKIGLSRGSEKLNVDIIPSFTVSGMVFKADKNGAPQLQSLNSLGYEVPDTGLKEGDVIAAVNGERVTTLQAFGEALKRISDESRAASGRVDKVSVNLALQDGRQAKLSMLAEDLVPEGKIGIMPAQATEFKFNNSTTNVLEAVKAGSPADKEGFKAGDTIFLVNGAHVSNIDGLQEILTKLHDGKEPAVFDMLRGDSEHVRIQVKDVPETVSELGLAFQPVTFGLTVKRSFIFLGRLIIAPVIIVEQLVNKVLSPEVVKSSMSGPLGIMQMIFELSTDSFGKFLYVVALINAAVGAFNVIPFPALDGARFLVLLIGKLVGHELDPKKEAWVHQIGLYILLGLVILVTIIDVQRLWAGVPLTQ